MSKKKLIHTGPGTELVRKLAAEGIRVFATDQARQFASSVNLSEGYLRQALHHLANSGWVIRLRNGLYAISPTVPGITPAHEFEIAMALVSPAAISHWSALHYHGLTEQNPRSVFVLTTTGVNIPRMRRAEANRKGGYLINGTLYRFVQVKPERFFGVEKVWVGEARVSITDPERTLLDGLATPRHFGDFAEVLNAFNVRGSNLDTKRIIEYALKLDAATAKRLGWVLERQGVEPSILEPLEQLPIKGYRQLDSSGPRKGPCDRRWMIQENRPGKVNS